MRRIVSDVVHAGSFLLADDGRGSAAPRRIPTELYLARSDIEHRRARVRRPETNGVVERFSRTVLEEFFRETFHESVEALQQDLDRWLIYYTTERSHPGYPTQGGRPIKTLERYSILYGKQPKEYGPRFQDQLIR